MPNNSSIAYATNSVFLHTAQDQSNKPLEEEYKACREKLMQLRRAMNAASSSRRTCMRAEDIDRLLSMHKNLVLSESGSAVAFTFHSMALHFHTERRADEDDDHILYTTFPLYRFKVTRNAAGVRVITNTSLDDEYSREAFFGAAKRFPNTIGIDGRTSMPSHPHAVASTTGSTGNPFTSVCVGTNPMDRLNARAKSYKDIIELVNFWHTWCSSANLRDMYDHLAGPNNIRLRVNNERAFRDFSEELFAYARPLAEFDLAGDYSHLEEHVRGFVSLIRQKSTLEDDIAQAFELDRYNTTSTPDREKLIESGIYRSMFIFSYAVWLHAHRHMLTMYLNKSSFKLAILTDITSSILSTPSENLGDFYARVAEYTNNSVIYNGPKKLAAYIMVVQGLSFPELSQLQ